jgi:hypothetical protein
MRAVLTRARREQSWRAVAWLGASACLLGSLVVAAPALADDPAPPREAPASNDRQDDRAPSRRPRFGAIGGLGFPRPLSIEGLVKIDDLVSVGAEYGVLPSVTLDNVETNLWSFAADARVFPFRNAFFVGLRAGRQHVGASTTVNVDSVGSLPETLALDSWFLNPRVGLLWTGASGLTVGAEIGIQIPVSSGVSSSLPLALAPEAGRTANTLGKTVLPTINLLQIGVLF